MEHVDKSHLEQAKEILYDHLETINEEYEECEELSDYSLDEMYKTIKTIHYIKEIEIMDKQLSADKQLKPFVGQPNGQS